MISPRSAAKTAAGLACCAALALAGCEKSIDKGGPLPQDNTDQAPAVGSTIPALPILSAPSFGPDFVTTVGDANLLDRAEARLAVQKSANSQVKALAARIDQEQSKVANGLQAAIDATGQRIFAPDSLSDLGQTKALLLGRLSGAEFDKAYLADATESQSVFYSSARDYARFGDTPALKRFAAAAVGAADQRLQAAKALQASLK